MSRTLVLCLGGTSNHYTATNTNVVKLYAMLDASGTTRLPTIGHPDLSPTRRLGLHQAMVRHATRPAIAAFGPRLSAIALQMDGCKGRCLTTMNRLDKYAHIG